LNIGELEKTSGVPRTTIYFYVRGGLLPVAQKKAASRAVYSQEHLDLLKLITRLKEEGLALEEIRKQVSPVVEAITAANADTAADHAEQLRQSILIAAAKLFPRKGYRGTRVADIIEEVGITPPVFYSHFASKQDLFVEAFDVFVNWMRRSLETRLPGEQNREARELSRVSDYYYGVRSVGFDLLSLVRSEAVRDDGDLRDPARDALKHMTSDTHEDLVGLRNEHDIKIPLVDELAAFGLFGIMDSMVMRACWDDKYSAADVLWTAYAFLLGLRAIYTGQLDVSRDVARDQELIEELSRASYQEPLADAL
jgi:TetR/AcrR family transcriptional regulator, transcriptional repressor for nem operon